MPEPPGRMGAVSHVGLVSDLGSFFLGGGGWFGAKGLVFRHGAGRGMSLGPCVWFAMMRPPKKPTCGGGGQGEIPFPRRVREGR